MHFFLFRKAIRKLPGDVIREVALPEPELTEGFGFREQTGRICSGMGARSVLVVTDRNIHGLGFHEKVLASLRDSGIPFSVFCDIDLEPTVDIIRAGRKAALECGADCIVAFGGGSVMDSSKAIAWCLVPVTEARKEKCLIKLWNLAVWCGISKQEDLPEEAADRKIIQLLDRIRKGENA